MWGTVPRRSHERPRLPSGSLLEETETGDPDYEDLALRQRSASLSGPERHQAKKMALTQKLLHPSRSENSSTPPPGGVAAAAALAPLNIMAASTAPKAHTSPSKASYGRTYDSKLVTREMQRLGGITHIPPGMSPAPSSGSVSMPSSSMSQSSLASNSTNDPWGALHVHVLPLFNKDSLRIPIETLNVLVKRHVQSVVSAGPPKALAALENDASELIAAGMVTLNANLSKVEEEKLLVRVVETWSFFWDHVLPYLEGVLLPLQTSPLLQSLYRTPKTHRGSSPSRQGAGKTSLSNNFPPPSALPPSNQIDVRAVALRSFRDRVILPLSQSLYKCLSNLNRQEASARALSYQQPRFQQILLVLSSLSRQRQTLSLTAEPTPGEQAVSDLLRVLLSPRNKPNTQNPISPSNKVRAPSFLSGGLPRDRRGRIAQKVQNLPALDLDDDSGDEFVVKSSSRGIGDEFDRERDREFLEALRSPDPETSTTTRASVGGWGLGDGGKHPDSALASGRTEDDDEEPLSWDQAQAQVERMLGMKAEHSEPPPPVPLKKSDKETRRRMT